MHNKSKSHHSPYSQKIQESKKYIDFIDYRKKNMVNMNIEEEDQPNLSLSQVGRISPLIYNNNGNRLFNIEKKDKSIIGISVKKQEIKEKIKDRIKAEIHNLIKRNTFNNFHIKKVQISNNIKQVHQQESVSIVGASVSPPFGLGYYEKIQKQNKKIKNIRKSILLSQMAFNSRKAKSSLDSRPITVETPSKNSKDQKLCCQPIYRRSMSTDIRVKSMKKRKISQVQNTIKSPKQKDQALQPWIISSFADDQQNF